MTEISDAAVRLCRESRAAQGLPPTIADPTVLDRVAALLDLTGYGVANSPAMFFNSKKPADGTGSYTTSRDGLATPAREFT